jgi:hypothetical protein
MEGAGRDCPGLSRSMGGIMRDGWMISAFAGGATWSVDAMSFGASVPLVIEIAVPCEGRAAFTGGCSMLKLVDSRISAGPGAFAGVWAIARESGTIRSGIAVSGPMGGREGCPKGDTACGSCRVPSGLGLPSGTGLGLLRGTSEEASSAGTGKDGAGDAEASPERPRGETPPWVPGGGAPAAGSGGT